jgi:hypothetical protein
MRGRIRNGSVTPDTEDRVQGHKTPQVERRMASAFSQNAPPPQGGLEQDKRHLGAPSPHFEGILSTQREEDDEGLPGAD